MRQNSCKLLYTKDVVNACTEGSELLLLIQREDTHTLRSRQVNLIQILLFLGQSFKLTPSEKVHRLNLWQNRTRIQSKPRIIVCKTPTFGFVALPFNVCNNQTIPVKMHQTQTAIYLAALIHMTVSHDIISIIYPYTSSPNKDKMICHQ